MKRSYSLVVGVLLVAVVVVLAVVSLFWTPYDPGLVDASVALRPPSRTHLLGTDGFGQDIFSRVLVGARICMIVGVMAVAIGALVGVPVGILAGMSRRHVGRRIMRWADIFYAFPALLLAILLAAANGRGSTVTAMVAIGISAIPAFARVANNASRGVMSHDYVMAARSSGIGWPAIAWRHVLPNILPVVLVQVSSTLGRAILAEAALSYLGLGTQPTTPTWGRMLYDAQKFVYDHPSQIMLPALFIAITVLGFNLLGDGLRETLDPRLRQET
ncbi:ABC transporter permease [Propionibacterium australiense]|uniref:ABC transporter permease subunit n=1 Tax=Propionibacterium australiense TaxID=119981 RepID=A0A383S389_9ACTN|nr:ABC transporter permease [Propionibacterium australiense]RLP11673.1 ABC transporter permease subunit [Propionibacterium australiense]RLP12186.1 ABC transporter permease subunit [Propionibacterium australiense]SYZ32407.1 Binding-protein-dependent transport system inner membrane component [Propionibacterium australiense]VEH90276.1 Glutathione transport system permease protein gsiD [Propionibacterium australiense]